MLRPTLLLLKKIQVRICMEQIPDILWKRWAKNQTCCRRYTKFYCYYTKSWPSLRYCSICISFSQGVSFFEVFGLNLYSSVSYLACVLYVPPIPSACKDSNYYHIFTRWGLRPLYHNPEIKRRMSATPRHSDHRYGVLIFAIYFNIILFKEIFTISYCLDITTLRFLFCTIFATYLPFCITRYPSRWPIERNTLVVIK